MHLIIKSSVLIPWCFHNFPEPVSGCLYLLCVQLVEIWVLKTQIVLTVMSLLCLWWFSSGDMVKYYLSWISNKSQTALFQAIAWLRNNFLETGRWIFSIGSLVHLIRCVYKTCVALLCAEAHWCHVHSATQWDVWPLKNTVWKKMILGSLYRPERTNYTIASLYSIRL